MGTGTTTSLVSIQGFEARVVRTNVVELTVVPELGAKVVSLRNLISGREWIWRPPGPFRLFRNRPGDDFAKGTLVGWDECLPTIAPCRWNGLDLPDHGEAWSAPWGVDESAWRKGEIATVVELPVSPLRFERTISLSGGVIDVRYRLINRSDGSQDYAWAMHPLLEIRDGDRIDVPGSTGDLDAAGWPADLSVQGRQPAMLKIRIPVSGNARASVRNSRTGDALRMDWDSSQNSMLGLWLTRGGWNGYHHLALEPTCASDDSLAMCVQKGGHFGRLAGRGTKNWSVTLRVEPTSGAAPG